jgi:hypothetical protein
MVQDPASDSADSERAELETVLGALVRNPRLAKLLKFLGERALQGRHEDITEYTIATEVFARSKTSFDATTDSIARVEAYRLRKRLKEYYATVGKEHPIVISLPFRSYVPEFSRRDSSSQPATTPQLIANTSDSQEFSPDETNAGETETTKTDQTPLAAGRKRARLNVAVAIVLLTLAVFGAFELIARIRSAHSANTARANPPNGLQSPTPANAAHIPLRLLAGYQGSPRIDSAGAYWEADRYFSGSGAFQRPDVPVSRTSDPMLFEHWRVGDFSYDIPLGPGPFELHLFFVATQPADFRTQFFNVSANGQVLLKAFNISADALGANIADEKIFRDMYADKDGYLHLKFVTDKASPSLNALEILPGIPHRQLPIRLVMQHTAVRDHDGNLWHPDNYFENGTVNDQPRLVTGTPDPSLYAVERYGHFTYSIPVDTRGRYTLVLHFAELYWIGDAAGSVGVGSRVFRVYCNGSTLLDNFDIFKEVGSLHALTKTFNHLRPSPEGKLDLTFEPLANYATVSAIEVIDESD